MPSCRKIFLLLALACQFAFAVVPPSGLLLCVGADGHFDVEAPHEGRACHEIPGASTPTGDCRDVQLTAIEAAERQNSRLDVLLSPVVIVELPLLVSAPSLCERPPHDAPPLDAFSRAARSNIVLLV